MMISMYHPILGHSDRGGPWLVWWGRNTERDLEKECDPWSGAYMVQCGERGKVEIRIFWNQNPNKACNIRYLFVFISPFPFGGLYHLCQSANSLLIWGFLPSTAPRSVCPAGAFCKARSGAPEPCPDGHFCPRGSTEPHACPGKHFCCLWFGEVVVSGVRALTWIGSFSHVCNIHIFICTSHHRALEFGNVGVCSEFLFLFLNLSSIKSTNQRAAGWEITEVAWFRQAEKHPWIQQTREGMISGPDSIHLLFIHPKPPFSIPDSAVVLCCRPHPKWWLITHRPCTCQIRANFPGKAFLKMSPGNLSAQVPIKPPRRRNARRATSARPRVASRRCVLRTTTALSTAPSPVFVRRDFDPWLPKNGTYRKAQCLDHKNCKNLDLDHASVDFCLSTWDDQEGKTSFTQILLDKRTARTQKEGCEGNLISALGSVGHKW